VLFRDIVFIVNGLNGAYRLTRTAVNTFVWLDVQHAVAFIDAIHRTLFNTRPVFEVYTGKGDDVGHVRSKK
jgi:hypothetical protein